MNFGCENGTSSGVPVVLDTDIGHDIDDTWALGMLLGWENIDLKLVVTGYDDTPEKARLVAKILDEAGRTDVAIGVGIKTSSFVMNQAEWPRGYDLSSYPGAIFQDGVDALIRAVKASHEPVTLLCIGPMTNIAEALRREPLLPSYVRRVVMMAGSIYQGYEVGSAPEPECNVVCDVPAFREVLSARWDITMTPLDGCGMLVLRNERFAKVKKSAGPLARIVVDNYDAWALRANYARDESSVLFDTAAAYLVVDDSFCVMETLAISVNEKGMTVPDEKGKTVNCHLGWKDRDGFEELLVNCLTGDNCNSRKTP